MSSAWSVIGKCAAGFGVVLLLSLGLCGVSIVYRPANNLAVIAIVGSVIGGAGLGLTGLAAIIVAIMSAFAGPTPPPPPPR